MPRLALLLALLLHPFGASAGTLVTLQGEGGEAEICRFAAGSAVDPFARWMTSQEMTCAPPGPEMVFPPGRWNVFARSERGISIEPLLVDGAEPPRKLALSLSPAATLSVQLPPGHTGVVYAPKRGTAYPVADRMKVPAAEELWLFLLNRSIPAGVAVVPAIEAGTERNVDARVPAKTQAVLAWVQLNDADRVALKTAQGTSSPAIRMTANGKEVEAATLPAPASLDGALLLFAGLAPGNGELHLSGRGWLPLRRPVTIGKQGVTLVRQPVPARASATLMVNWSTYGDLAALDRSLGACEPSQGSPRFDLILSSCAQPASGEPVKADDCTQFRTEALIPQTTFGSVTAEEVPPGIYRAELRFGKLPPVAVTAPVAPLQHRPIPPLQASYNATYGSLTRGGEPLEDDAQISFPGGGVGFAPRGPRDYQAVLTGLIGPDAKIDVTTCGGEQAFVLTDRPIRRNARFDIDIPDNKLTVTVVDTFTHLTIETATLRYAVMSAALPRRPVVTRTLQQDGARRDGEGGRLVIRGVPERELRMEVTNPGYKKQAIDPFSMTKSEEKEIEVQLVPLSGAKGKIVSGKAFERATIVWFSQAGVESERTDLAPDGTFFFDETHFRGETMTVVSLSHPLWIVPAPAVKRATPLEVRFPDAAPVREPEVWIPGLPDRVLTPIGVSIGGLRVPALALAQHLALRGARPVVVGSGPTILLALAESGPIDVLRGSSAVPNPRYPVELVRDFPPVAVQRLPPGLDRVVFETAKPR